MSKPPAHPALTASQHAAGLAKAQVSSLSNQWEGFEIKSDDDAALCVQTALEMKAQRDSLWEMREGWAKPLRDTARSIGQFFKGPVDSLDTMIATLRGKATQWEVSKAKAREAALAQAVKSQRPADIAAIVTTASPVTSGLQVREHWVAEVVDESQIPRRFWILDTAALNREATTHKANLGAIVPGVRGVNKPTGALVGNRGGQTR